MPDICHKEARENQPVPTAKASRRPPGYWQDFENVKRELVEVAAAINRPGIMPNGTQMKLNGRRSLKDAVTWHGGVKRVAELAGLRLRKRKAAFVNPKRTSHGESNHLAHAGKIRQGRLPRKNEDRLYLLRELSAFIRSRGHLEVMPTAPDRIQAGRADLVKMIGIYGGFKRLAKQMGLKRKYKLP